MDSSTATSKPAISSTKSLAIGVAVANALLIRRLFPLSPTPLTINIEATSWGFTSAPFFQIVKVILPAKRITMLRFAVNMVCAKCSPKGKRMYLKIHNLFPKIKLFDATLFIKYYGFPVVFWFLFFEYEEYNRSVFSFKLKRSFKSYGNVSLELRILGCQIAIEHPLSRARRNVQIWKLSQFLSGMNIDS